MRALTSRLVMNVTVPRQEGYGVVYETLVHQALGKLPTNK